jgi:hypothetical protein
MTGLTFRQRTLVVGDDDFSRISRAGYYLDNNQLHAAVNELQQASSAVREAYGPWLARAQQRVSVTLALDLLAAHVSTLSLAVA